MEMNIVEKLQAEGDYSILISAVQRAGLDVVLSGEGSFTVFAPTDAAFGDLLQALNVSDLDGLVNVLGGEDALRQVLLYHVLGAEVPASAVSTGWVSTLAELTTGNMDYLSVYLNTQGGVTINEVNIDETDIEASNGVIHQIAGVITPLNVAEIAGMDERFSVLMDAVGAADPAVAARLTGNDNTTVFAPTNDAFVDLLDRLQLPDLAAVVNAIGQNGLTDILLYHTVDGNVRSTALSNGSVPTLLGADITVDVSGPSITDENGDVADIIITDVQGSNGVVHAIDFVIQPM
jgi:uncharacterized surface protein with fasciclin (FAS1) repeats